MEFTSVFEMLRNAKNPEDVFSTVSNNSKDAMVEVEVQWKRLSIVVHPDTNKNSIVSQNAMSLLNQWKERADTKIGQNRWGQKDSGITIQARKLYKNVTFLATGDICDVYMAEQENGPRAVLKIVIDQQDQDLVQNEAAVLTKLRSSINPRALSFQRYLPKLLEQTRVKVDGKERLTNIIEACERGYTLEQVHAKHSALDPRNVAWIWKRMLEGIGWVNIEGIIHGAIVPSHVIVYPYNHGVCIIDWSYATEKKPLKAISTKFKSFYPPEVFRKEPALPGVDIYMIAKCALYLFGGNPETDYIPDTIPDMLRGFLRACLLRNTLMRFQNTWDVLEELTDNLRKTFGPRKFVELEM